MWWGFRGIPPAQMNSMVPGTHMGRLRSPKPALFNDFVGISTFPGKLQVAPASLAYFPLWGPAAVAEGLRYFILVLPATSNWGWDGGWGAASAKSLRLLL